MPSVLEHLAAKIAYIHAKRVYGRFLHTLHNVDQVQNTVLRKVLTQLSRSDYGRQYDLKSVRTPTDLKKAAPVVTYEDLRPYIDRLCEGDIAALLAPGEHLHMFATSSGTTAKQKLIPVTTEFVRQYRRGWNTFGLKMLSDHPKAILRDILQGSGRFDETHTASGVPCGAITGLLARTQKGIVRRFYVGKPEIAYISDSRAKYYTLMRYAIARDVAFAITANPSTLIRMAQTANEESEQLIRDIRDGTIAPEFVSDSTLRARLETHLKPNPRRARELEQIRSSRDQLRPRDYWNLEFLACWTAGSMGHYLSRLAEWWGSIPVRDIGLLASEGRVTLPLDDNTAAGVLDSQSAFFEFIPAEQWDQPDAQTFTASELEVGEDYTVVLTNSAGLVRYRLDDVVSVRGRLHRTPILEFIHRAGRVASVAGEKLTENQVVEAVRIARDKLSLPEFDFILSPHWQDPPFYQLSCVLSNTDKLARVLDEELGEQNAEYRSRRNSLRLSMLRIRSVASDAFTTLDSQLIAQRGSTAEQYKRPCLMTEPGQDDNMLSESK